MSLTNRATGKPVFAEKPTEDEIRASVAARNEQHPVTQRNKAMQAIWDRQDHAAPTPQKNQNAAVEAFDKRYEDVRKDPVFGKRIESEFNKLVFSAASEGRSVDFGRELPAMGERLRKEMYGPAYKSPETKEREEALAQLKQGRG